jgi:hypothetical protein
MAFPATIRTTQASGYPGDLALQFPPVAQPGVLNSADAANNVIGRAFTHTGTEGEVRAGGAGAFAGILANKAEYASYGTTAGGPLAPATTLPNGAIGDFILEHPGVFVTLSTAFAVGVYVTYNTTTGALGSVASGVDVPAGFAILPGAFVKRFASASPGLAIISLGTNTTPHVGGS